MNAFVPINMCLFIYSLPCCFWVLGFGFWVLVSVLVLVFGVGFLAGLAGVLGVV